MNKLIEDLIAVNCLSGCSALEKIERKERILENHLQTHPTDTDGWLRLAINDLHVPLVDIPKSIECVEKVISYEPDNRNAWLLLAYMERTYHGEISQHIMEKLMVLAEEEQYDKIHSLLYLAQAWGFEEQNVGWQLTERGKKYEQCLLASIQHGPSYVSAYTALGDYYLVHGKRDQAQKHFHRALQNICIVSETTYATIPLEEIKSYLGEAFQGFCPLEDDTVDDTDVERFMQKHFYGTHVTDLYVESIVEKSKPAL